MNIKIQSIHFDADQKLTDFINEKLSKIENGFGEIVDCEVFLKLDKNTTTENKVVEIKLLIPGNGLFAKRQCKTFEEATDQSIDALRKQIKKYKEKLRATTGIRAEKTI